MFGITLLAGLVSANLAHAEDIGAAGRAKIVPKLDAFPHTALPPGNFKGWCGKKDRFLVEVGGALDAYDGSTKAATIAVDHAWPSQCSEDGEQLIYVDTRMGHVIRVDIASGKSSWLASYDVPKFGASLGLSPDLQSIAADVTLDLKADAEKLKVIVVKPEEERGVRDIKWSSDSSQFVVSYFESIHVFDSKGVKLGSGPLPKGTYPRESWFDASGRALIVYLALDKDESGPGLMVKCRISQWKCERFGPRVDSVSVGSHGLIATVGPLGKITPPEDGGWISFYPTYAAEIRDASYRILARQIYRTANGRADFALSISPSANAAVVTWMQSASASCRPPPQSSYCRLGTMVNLSKGPK